jgi:hypothetical protein
MIQVLRIALMLAVLFLAPLQAQVQAYTGNQLLSECEAPAATTDAFSCLRFIVGMNNMHNIDTECGRQPFYCLPTEATNGQLKRIVEKYLRAHPEELHRDTAYLVVEALMEAFPCKR